MEQSGSETGQREGRGKDDEREKGRGRERRTHRLSEGAGSWGIRCPACWAALGSSAHGPPRAPALGHPAPSFIRYLGTPVFPLSHVLHMCCTQIGEVVAFLASDSSSYMTGQVTAAGCVSVHVVCP